MKLYLGVDNEFVNEESEYVYDAGIREAEPFEVPSLEWLENFILNSPCSLMFSKDDRVPADPELIKLEHPYSY